MDERVSRRHFTVTAGCALASVAFGGACVSAGQQSPGSESPVMDPRTGRMAARPRLGVTTSLKSGPLGLGDAERDALIQMPSTMPDGKVPLLVFLHGATQSGAAMIRRIGSAADLMGVAILAPDSREGTWDAIRGQFGVDVSFLNRALEHVFARLNVDPSRVALGGFSDGASYALSLGLANGDLFPRIVACSPGFVMPAPSNGHPRVFVSHGRSDQILPIDECSRVIVPRLRAMGYDVTFREFDGRHELPPDIAVEALRWMANA